MIRIAEYLLVRFQNRVGIPKWWLLTNSLGLAAVLVIVHSLLENRSLVVPLIGATFVLAGMAPRLSAEKSAQQRADRTLMVVLNRERASTFWRWLRRMWVFMLMLDLVPPIKLISIAESSVWLAACTLIACDTFPMVGPSLKDRIKNLFTMRRMKAATNET